jgi:hypothetical protein
MFEYEITLYFEFWGEELVRVKGDTKEIAMRKAISENPEAIAIRDIKCLTVLN